MENLFPHREDVNAKNAAQLALVLSLVRDDIREIIYQLVSEVSGQLPGIYESSEALKQHNTFALSLDPEQLHQIVAHPDFVSVRESLMTAIREAQGIDPGRDRELQRRLGRIDAHNAAKRDQERAWFEEAMDSPQADEESSSP